MIPAGASQDMEPGNLSEIYGEILAESARMMMDDESNHIEIDLLRLLAEEAFSGRMDDETARALAERVETLSLLEKDVDNEYARVFPHENIKSFFFAKNILSYFPEHGPTNALYRVPLSMEDFRMFNCVVRFLSPQKQNDIRNTISESMAKANDSGYLVSNLGGFLLSFLPLDSDDDSSDRKYSKFVLTSRILRDAWIADQAGVQHGELIDCRLSRLDVRGADLSRVTFYDVEVDEMLVDPFVKFGESVPKVRSLVFREPSGRDRTTYDLQEIEEWISSKSDHGVSVVSQSPLWPLLEKFSRLSMKSYWVREGDHLTRVMTNSKHWKPLCELLGKYNRIDISDKVGAGGPQSNWFHLVRGREFLEIGQAGKDTKSILKELGVI